MRVKKMLEVEVDICDNCGKQDSFGTKCNACEFVACYDCRKKVVIEYMHGVYFSGSDDGYYCKPCDIKLSEDKSDALHNAYVEIKKLRDERQAFYFSFDKRATTAQEILQKCLRKI